MILTLKRYTTDAPATLGTLTVDGSLHSDTIELPWRDNQPRISCIPAGRYRVTLEYSVHLKRATLRLQDVPGRSGILIHPANHPDELEGCITLGKRYSRDGVMESRMAVEALEAKARAAMAKGEEVWIDVEDPV